MREVTEKYTSKACSECGNLRYNLKDAKEYRCLRSSCRANTIPMCRDGNGAKNILLKWLIDNDLSVEQTPPAL